jgi:hypothetical protein
MKTEAKLPTILYMTITMLFFLGFLSIMLWEIQSISGALLSGKSYNGPYFDSEGITTGVYMGCFFGPIILYFVPYVVGVGMLLAKASIYSSKVNRGVLGLKVGVVGGVILLIFECIALFVADEVDASIWYFPLGYTLISAILFTVIPPIFKKLQ